MVLTFTWHASKFKVHKLLQRCVLKKNQHMHAHTHKRTHIHTRTHARTHARTHTHTHTHTRSTQKPSNNNNNKNPQNREREREKRHRLQTFLCLEQSCFPRPFQDPPPTSTGLSVLVRFRLPQEPPTFHDGGGLDGATEDASSSQRGGAAVELDGSRELRLPVHRRDVAIAESRPPAAGFVP